MEPNPLKTYEYWRERATGHVWAIELVDGVVVGCCGPLDRDELEERFLPTLDYSGELAAWAESTREDFEPYPLIPA